jgi:hypothetical protein
MLRYTDHMGLVISTRSAEAAANYAEGVQLLISGSPAAVPVLQMRWPPASLGVLLMASAMTRLRRNARSVDLDVLELALAASSERPSRRQHIQIVMARCGRWRAEL